jgi:hypothetical protein
LDATSSHCGAGTRIRVVYRKPPTYLAQTFFRSSSC